MCTRVHGSIDGVHRTFLHWPYENGNIDVAVAFAEVVNVAIVECGIVDGIEVVAVVVVFDVIFERVAVVVSVGGR